MHGTKPNFWKVVAVASVILLSLHVLGPGNLWQVAVLAASKSSCG